MNQNRLKSRNFSVTTSFSQTEVNQSPPPSRHFLSSSCCRKLGGSQLQLFDPSLRRNFLVNSVSPHFQEHIIVLFRRFTPSCPISALPVKAMLSFEDIVKVKALTTTRCGTIPSCSCLLKTKLPCDHRNWSFRCKVHYNIECKRLPVLSLTSLSYKLPSYLISDTLLARQ